MKKIILASALFTAMAFMFTGCLKDKGFDNHEYGINDPDTQPPGVGFPKGTATQSFGLNVSATIQVVNDMIYINLESGKPASADVHITLTDNTTALVAAYNAANGLTGTSAVLALPTSLYNTVTSLTIPAGERFVHVPLNVTNTTSLDPNRSYAVGYTITAVDGGYTIASNLKNLLIKFSIKNRLDGIYEITGAALRAGDALLSGNFGPYQRAMATSGPNSVQWAGSVPWANGSGSSLPDGYQPNVTVDPVSNLVTSLTSPNGAIFMTVPVVRTDILNGTTQRYDVATKTLYFEFTYTTPANRLFSMKARYIGPR